MRFGQVEHSRLVRKLPQISANFRAGFKTLSFSQLVYSLLAAEEGTNPETAGRTDWLI